MDKAPRDPLLVEREKTHGDFEDNARLHEKLMMAIMSELNSTMNAAQRLAISMLMLKVCRAMANPLEPEHWKDMGGYAKLGEEQCYSK